MKSILIVTEQFTIGGLETHIRGEIAHQSKSGVEVHLATGKTFQDALLPAGLSSIAHGLPLDPACTPEQLLAAINQLRKIIHEHSIERVHVHPFTSIIPAVAAAELERIPYAITLHGPASMASYGPIYDLLIKDIVLPNAPLIITVSSEVRRLLTNHAADESVICIPNTVAFEEFSGVTSTANSIDQRWLVVSRLDQFKIQGIVDFCIKAKACGIPGVVIAGDGPAKPQLLNMLEEHDVSGYAHLMGMSTEVHSLIQTFAGVAGMGRVILEGVAARKPVVLVGYDGVKGVVDKLLLTQSAEQNFSGRSLPTIDFDELSAQLRGKTGGADVSAVFEVAKAAFNDRHAWTRFLDQMSSLAIPAPTALTGLYHSLSGSPIAGTAPYLHSIEILDRMETVVCCKKYYDPRLLAAVSFCRQRLENASLNQELVTRDGQIASLNQEVVTRDGQIASLNQEVVLQREQLDDLFNSTSMRITKPMRFAKRLYLAMRDKSERYSFLKDLYWNLPQSLRLRLNERRHQYVARHFRERTDSFPKKELSKTTLNDLSTNQDWIVAANSAQKIAIIPCGFEFDELVNQRPINAAKYFALKNYLVLFIPWQWSRGEGLAKGVGHVWQGIYQVPLFDFIDYEHALPTKRLDAMYLLTFPAKILVDLVPTLRGRAYSIVYDVMDEWEEFHKSGQAPWFDLDVERHLVLESDVVCAVAPALVSKFSNIRDDILLIGNGYTPEMLGIESRAIAGSQDGTNHTVGYFGHLTEAWFDWSLVFALADAHPNIQFDLIGYGEPQWVNERIKHSENIKLIGKIHPRDLHEHVRRWGFGIIPFFEGALAQAVDPIKIYEYLYFGMSAFVTGIEHLKSYPNVFFASRATAISEFAKFIEQQTVGNLDLDDFLDKTTWNSRFSCLEDYLSQKKKLGDLYVD